MEIDKNQLSVLRENNRRSHERVRFYIQEALLLLMEEKDYDKIKITDIIKRAGVSRSAFYRSYYWKKDILVDMCTRLALEEDRIKATDDVMKNWEYLFEHIKRHERFYTLMEKTLAILCLILCVNLHAQQRQATSRANECIDIFKEWALSRKRG